MRSCSAGIWGLYDQSNASSVFSSSKRARCRLLGQHLGLPPVDLVVQQQGQELQMPEPLVFGLGPAQLQGVQHPAQLQRLEVGLQVRRLHRPPSSRAPAPCNQAPAGLSGGAGSSTAPGFSSSPFTVR